MLAARHKGADMADDRALRKEGTEPAVEGKTQPMSGEGETQPLGAEPGSEPPADQGAPTIPAAPPPTPDVGPSVEELAANRIVPEFESAIQRKSATFAQLVQATAYSHPNFPIDPVDRAVNARYVGPLTEAFESAEGGIASTYYDFEIQAATALTQRTRRRRFGVFSPSTTYGLHSVNNETDPDDVALLNLNDRVGRLFTDCAAYLSGQDLSVCADSLYSIQTNLFSYISGRAASRKQGITEYDDAELVTSAGRQLDNVDQHYRRAAQRDAQIHYFGGMMLGLLALTLLGALLSFADLPGPDRYVDAAFIAGATGAVVSVMSRMSSGSLKLRFETGKWYIRYLGMFRPFIGAVFGVMLYALLAGGVLAVDPPADETQAFFFYVVVAFLAGFSERFAQDMLSVGEDTVRGAKQTGSGDDVGLSQRDESTSRLPSSDPNTGDPE